MNFSRMRSVNVVALLLARLSELRLTWASFTPGLGGKFLLIAVAVALLSVITSSLLVLSFERQHIIENTETASHPLSTAIWASLEHAMLSNDRPMVDQIVQTMVHHGGVGRIRVLDPSGIVRRSSADDVGTRLYRDQPECENCHVAEGRPVLRTATLQSADGTEVSLEVVPIRNRPECGECHHTRADVLGILMIETPLTLLPQQLTATLSRLALSSLITALVLVALMALALRTLVTRPVKELTRGVAEIGAGNLGYEVQATSDDELGELARAFEATRQQLKLSRVEMDLQNRELSEVNAMALTAVQLLDTERILELALDTAVNKLGMARATIYLHDSSSGRFVLHACRGLTEAQVQTIQARRQQSKWDISSQVGRTGEAFFVPDMAADGRFYRAWDDMRNRSYLNVPLKSRGGLVGTMGIVTQAGKPMKTWEIGVFEAVGYIAGISIENARLYHQVRQFATIEERSRLAREMHDNLAQVLGFIKIRTAFTDDLLSKGETGQARASLAELKRIADEAYADAREAIYSLRVAGPAGNGLGPRLRDHIHQYHSLCDIEVHLEPCAGEIPDVPPATEIQVIRIVQEALANARKHSHARHVWIRCEHDAKQMQITVEDDEDGFDPHQTGKDVLQHVGLQIMRERAESVGGELEIDSNPGRGAHIVIRVPRTGG